MQLFGFFGLQRNFGGIVFRAYMLYPGQTPAADDKAAGEKKISRMFIDGVRFAGKQRFIDLYLPLADNTIRADLMPGGKLYNIIQHQRFHGNLRKCAVAQHLRFGRGQNGQLFDGFFGADFLNDTD